MFLGTLTKAIAFTIATPKQHSLRATPSTTSTSSTSLQYPKNVPQVQVVVPSVPQQRLQQHDQQQQQPPLSTTTTTLPPFCLDKMCHLFQVEPANNLFLSNNLHDGTNTNRGLCLKTAVKQGDVILSIPITSCFRDDEPPRWFHQEHHDYHDNSNTKNNDNNFHNLDEELHVTDYERYNPSAWSTRLAASILDMEFFQKTSSATEGGDSEEYNSNNNHLIVGRDMWRAHLPDKNILRASLPVHWDEDILTMSKCTALELAVDSAYFARANAVSTLSEELWKALNSSDENNMLEKKCGDVLDIALDMETLQRKCHDALDLVQTRACRVERSCEDGVQWGPPLRIVAPVFDFINHGSRASGEGSANAYFGVENEQTYDMEEARLVVRAIRDVGEGEEVLIDYGESACPNWRCLTSYGFVPDYDANFNGVDEVQDMDVAELWMNGIRFEVNAQSVPYDLVELATAQVLLDQTFEDDSDDEGGGGDDDGNLVLSPFVARAISKRATEAAFNLILEPDIDDTEEVWDAPEFLHAMNLAALLRWSQHKVLMAFAENLSLFAASASKNEG